MQQQDRVSHTLIAWLGWVGKQLHSTHMSLAMGTGDEVQTTSLSSAEDIVTVPSIRHLIQYMMTCILHLFLQIIGRQDITVWVSKTQIPWDCILAKLPAESLHTFVEVYDSNVAWKQCLQSWYEQIWSQSSHFNNIQHLLLHPDIAGVSAQWRCTEIERSLLETGERARSSATLPVSGPVVSA